ncbi:YciE/YciF ferroxidase family protein [Geminicoccus flavidas]|uniref:YciE/YciF ferroxidase family protein n=1 Tax=Geminicoccus flavidas TaxID=2506407 RepID=UPI00135759F2|nr:DUF892 family protein [Geminicoccus flavidas]
MSIQTLEDLYTQQLQALFCGETQLCELVTALREAAGHKDLDKIFGDWIEQGLQRRHMLEQILGELGQEVDGTTADPIVSIREASLALIESIPEPDMRDAGLIAAAQRVAHYREAGYRALAPFAVFMKRKHDQHFIENSARESREAGEQLSQLATRTMHRAAAASYQMAG